MNKIILTIILSIIIGIGTALFIKNDREAAIPTHDIQIGSLHLDGVDVVDLGSIIHGEYNGDTVLHLERIDKREEYSWSFKGHPYHRHQALGIGVEYFEPLNNKDFPKIFIKSIQ